MNSRDFSLLRVVAYLICTFILKEKECFPRGSCCDFFVQSLSEAFYEVYGYQEIPFFGFFLRKGPISYWVMPCLITTLSPPNFFINSSLLFWLAFEALCRKHMQTLQSMFGGCFLNVSLDKSFTYLEVLSTCYIAISKFLLFNSRKQMIS